MRPIIPTWILAAAAALVLVAGTVDSIISGEWDLFVVFAIALVLVAVMSVRTKSGRHDVTLRSDLARWASDHAYRTGETPETTLDRAVAGHRRRVDPAEGHTAIFAGAGEGAAP
jgi:hypothetical protein